MTSDDPTSSDDPTGTVEESAELVTGDVGLLAELRAGRAADPSTYEVADFTCEVRDDGFWTSASITNRLDRAWAFDLEFVVTDAQGEVVRWRTSPGFGEPGGTVSAEVPWGLDGFGASSPCELNVLHAPILALQDPATLQEIREVLDAQP